MNKNSKKSTGTLDCWKLLSRCGFLQARSNNYCNETCADHPIDIVPGAVRDRRINMHYSNNNPHRLKELSVIRCSDGRERKTEILWFIVTIFLLCATRHTQFTQIKSFMIQYWIYYAEACNEFPGPSLRHCARATLPLSKKCRNGGEPQR